MEGVTQLYVSTNDVAKTMGVSLNTVGKWCRTGTIPCVRIGGKYQIHKAWFDQYVEASKNWKADYAKGSGDAA